MTVFSNLICYRYRWGREYIQPRASKRYLKSRAVLDDRAFQAQITGDQPDRSATMLLFHIALFGMDIYYRRESHAISRRETRLEKVQITDRLRIESGE